MANLKDTNLSLQVGKLAPTFRGKPQDLFDALVRLSKIVSPAGTNFIFTGDTEPSSNVGPWLRNGTQWWVFDEETKRYVPLDISQSETIWYKISSTVPTDSTPPVWLKVTNTPTATSPNPGRALGWYVFSGTTWVPFNGIVNSGPTANRPTSPFDLEQFYDSDISALIWFERGAWRTVSGSPGDIKFVASETLTEALRLSPGWSLLGASNADFRGRIIVQATKDPGGSPESDFNTNPNVAHRAAHEIFGVANTGATDFIKIDNVTPGLPPFPAQVAFWCLTKD